MHVRIRKRYVVLAFACTAALAIGGLASANHVSNRSTLSGSKITPSNLPKNRRVPITLFVHTGTVYAHPNDAGQGGKAATVTLLFDDDGALNLRGIPRCTASFTSGTTIAQAWERCGPGADGPGEVNAYLSPRSGVSGRVSTAPPSNFNGCSLTFNGPRRNGNPTVLLFSRVTLVPNGTANCSNPATNTSGNTTVTLRGTITTMPASSDFGRRLRVPNIDAAPLPLDDYTSKTRRGDVFTARCFDGNRILNSRGIFQYSGSGQPTDVVNHRQTCTVR
jgi:hypothetical protein